MKDYTVIDPASLTFEDAYSDESFGRSVFDYLEYICIDVNIMETVDEDFTIEEAGEVFKLIAHYCCTGQYPDFTQMSTTAVKSTVRGLIHAHDMRMKSEYLRHYRQFVASQAKKQGKTTK